VSRAAGISCATASQRRGLRLYRPGNPKANRYEGHASWLRSVFNRLRPDSATAGMSVRELGGRCSGRKKGV